MTAAIKARKLSAASDRNSPDESLLRLRFRKLILRRRTKTTRVKTDQKDRTNLHLRTYMSFVSTGNSSHALFHIHEHTLDHQLFHLIFLMRKERCMF
jgi:hypothetical protein